MFEDEFIAQPSTVASWCCADVGLLANIRRSVAHKRPSNSQHIHNMGDNQGKKGPDTKRQAWIKRQLTVSHSFLIFLFQMFCPFVLFCFVLFFRGEPCTNCYLLNRSLHPSLKGIFPDGAQPNTKVYIYFDFGWIQFQSQVSVKNSASFLICWMSRHFFFFSAAYTICCTRWVGAMNTTISFWELKNEWMRE